jgi:hypothetical protein
MTIDLTPSGNAGGIFHRTASDGVRVQTEEIGQNATRSCIAAPLDSAPQFAVLLKPRLQLN